MTIFAIDLTFSNFIFLTYIKYCFFSFATTSQEEERSDLMSFLTVTTNLIEGIVAVCYKNKFHDVNFLVVTEKKLNNKMTVSFELD